MIEKSSHEKTANERLFELLLEERELLMTSIRVELGVASSIEVKISNLNERGVTKD